MTTLDLFTTTVDAVGMNGTVTGGLYYLLLLVGTPTLLITPVSYTHLTLPTKA